MRDFQKPGRSVAYSSRAMCATSHPHATLAALDVLKEGGNAVDAAVAASAVLCVVEPQSTGIGGDCFAIIARPGEPLRGLNASGRSPMGLDPEPLLASGAERIDVNSPHAVTVPGAIDGWSMLIEAYGTRGFDRLLAPAIAHAEDGFVVTPRVASDWRREEPRLRHHAGARRHLLKDGAAPAEGAIMHSPALAQSLRAIAREGRRGFYEGAVAEDMVATLRALGGAHALEDFARHRGQWVEPIAGAHAGLDLAEIPPNGHGVTALVILAILDRLGVKPDGPVTARRYHLLIEAARQAYRARDTFIADPEKADVPLAHLLSGALADELASRIDPDRRRADLGPVPPPPGSDTIYLSVVDRDGMAVSFINSVFWSFGSAIVSEKTGIALQNRGCGFVLSRGHRNVLAPAKRPLHTIIPAMATRNGEAEICFGVMGGAYQPVGHVTAFTNMVDFGLDPQAALDAPRCFFEGDSLVAEHGVPDDVAATLGAMGHAVVRPDEPLGGGQIIRIDRARGVLIGGSDPRKDGFVAGL